MATAQQVSRQLRENNKRVQATAVQRLKALAGDVFDTFHDQTAVDTGRCRDNASIVIGDRVPEAPFYPVGRDAKSHKVRTFARLKKLRNLIIYNKTPYFPYIAQGTRSKPLGPIPAVRRKFARYLRR